MDPFAHQGVAVADVIAGFEMACEKAQEILETLVCHTVEDPRDVEVSLFAFFSPSSLALSLALSLSRPLSVPLLFLREWQFCFRGCATSCSRCCFV